MEEECHHLHYMCKGIQYINVREAFHANNFLQLVRKDLL
jgi:hypothetical protein